MFAPPAHRSALHHGSEVYCCNTSHSRFFPIPQLTRESPFRTPPPDGHNEESYAILLHLNSKWPTSRSMKELLRLMKNNVKGKVLCCEKYPRDREHRYHSAGTLDRFRLRCCVCKHTLSESEARNYFGLSGFGVYWRKSVCHRWTPILYISTTSQPFASHITHSPTRSLNISIFDVISLGRGLKIWR